MTSLAMGVVLVANVSGGNSIVATVCVVIALACQRVVVDRWLQEGACLASMSVLLIVSTLATPTDAEPAGERASAFVWLAMAASCLHATAPCFSGMQRFLGMLLATVMIAVKANTVLLRSDLYGNWRYVLLPVVLLVLHDNIRELANLTVSRMVYDPSERRKRQAGLWYVIAWSLTFGFISSKYVSCMSIVQSIHVLLLLANISKGEALTSGIKTGVVSRP
jgi:hypothetical protein